MRVSVIISNRNDVEMLGVTVRSCIEELSAVPGGGEVVIVDNSDDEIYEALPSLLPAGYRKGKDPKIRYFRQDYPCLFSARQTAAEKAKGDYIFCVDSHCLIGHNTIVDLVHFMNRNKHKKIGFAHAPVNWLCQWEGASRHDMKEIYGTWGRLYSDERMISWKGMPWMCRRDWFLNTLKGYDSLAKHKIAWGGGDMYLGLKTWILGYENWAVPTRAAIHIGPLPSIARKFWKYRRYSDSGEGLPGIGFMIALYAIGGDNLVDTEKFKNFLNDRFSVDTEKYKDHAKKIAQEEREHIERNKVINFNDMWDNPPWKTTTNYNDVKSEFKKKIGDASKCLKKEDWNVLNTLINDHKIKTVVEFGSGLSTVLMQRAGLKVTSFETDGDYLTKLDPLLSNDIDIRLWDNKADINFNGDKFDLAIIDGALPRTKQAVAAKGISDLVIVHDGHKRQCGYHAAMAFSDWDEVLNDTRLTRVFKRNPMAVK